MPAFSRRMRASDFCFCFGLDQHSSFIRLTRFWWNSSAQVPCVPGVFLQTQRPVVKHSEGLNRFGSTVASSWSQWRIKEDFSRQLPRNFSHNPVTLADLFPGFSAASLELHCKTRGNKYQST